MNEHAALIIKELQETMEGIDERDLKDLVAEMSRPGRRVFLMGVGRVLISLKAWVKRMKHLGIDINFVGDETEMPMRDGDLLVVASSSGESALPKAIAGIAKRYDGMVFYLGCNPQSTLAKMADRHLYLKGRTKLALPGEYPSRQPMSTLFEQQLYLLGDVISLQIMDDRHLSEADIKDRHANLE